jgi:hypothetical protein
MTNGLQERWGRETRLLVLIVVVSLAVLLVLARFRFPAATLSVAPAAPSPLSNLVSRAAFEELAEAMASTANRITPKVVVVRLAPVRPPAAARGGRGADPSPNGMGTTLVLGLRVRPDLALVRVPAGMMPAELVDVSLQPEIVGADSKRELALIRLPASADGAIEPADPFVGFAYLGEATATFDGPTLQPVFIGRTGQRQHERWPAALTGIDNRNVSDGSILFTIDGRLIGLVVHDAAGTAVVPPAVIDTAVNELLSGPGGAS